MATNGKGKIVGCHREGAPTLQIILLTFIFYHLAALEDSGEPANHGAVWESFESPQGVDRARPKTAGSDAFLSWTGKGRLIQSRRVEEKQVRDEVRGTSASSLLHTSIPLLVTMNGMETYLF